MVAQSLNGYVPLADYKKFTEGMQKQINHYTMETTVKCNSLKERLDNLYTDVEYMS